MNTNVRFSSNNTPDLISNHLQDESESALEPEKVVLLSPAERKDAGGENSVNFVEKIDEIMSSTDKLYLRECPPLSPNESTPEPFASYDIDVIFDVLNGLGETVLRMGRCRDKANVQSFVISTDVGHGVITLSTKGFLNQICDVEGGGLLKFTQIHHINGSYTLRDEWKELLKIRSSWIPFCTCCLSRKSKSATLAIVNLDGTPTGTMCYKKWLNLDFEDRTMCVHFIPNLNPKAKYMLLAASLKPLCNYFSEPGRSRRIGSLYCTYFALFIIFLGLGGAIAKFI